MSSPCCTSWHIMWAKQDEQNSHRRSHRGLQTAIAHLDMREPSSDTRGAARKSPCLLARSLHKHASEKTDGLERPTCKGFKHFVKIPHSQARAGALQEPTSTDQRASTSSTNPPQISSSKWPLILGRSTMQASRFVEADSGSSKGPMVMCRLDGEAIGSLPSEYAGFGNGYVTSM